LSKNFQIQKQSQQFKILPQQIQFLNLLHLNVSDLNQYIEHELEENPFLEEGSAAPEVTEAQVSDDLGETDDFEEMENWGSVDDDIADIRDTVETGFAGETEWRPTEVQHETWRQDMKRQVHFLSDDVQQHEVLDYLIDCLDESGFLRLSVDNVVDDFAFTRSQVIEYQLVKEAIALLQTLEPAGIGARDVRESLMIQINSLKHNKQLKQWCTVVVDKYLPQLAAHNYEPIMEALGIESDEMSYVIDLVRSLNPKPLQGQADEGEASVRIQPDFLVEREGEVLVASVLSSGGASVRISPDADMYLTSYKDKTAKVFVKQKVEEARWLVEAIQQRNDTLLRTIQILVQEQKAFFLTGDYSLLKPMILKDIAVPLELNVSTISRITSTKYVQTEFGVLPLKDLFFQTFTTQDGRELTNREVQEVLQSIVDQEDKSQPLNDSQIQELLGQKGYTVARRTVAKYREALSIPVADLRRMLKIENEIL
jgi:RNA polymerase sigma-54 factor